MPRSFELSADYEGTVGQLHRAFRDEEYWRARLADIPVDVARLESMRVGGETGNDGTIEVVTLQMVRSHNLHSIVRQLHRGDVAIRRKETWGPVTDGAATATLVSSIDDTPVHISGTAELSPIAESGGARVDFQITVQVRVPLLGGKVERLIGNNLGELIYREQQFTAEWIAKNA
jgi:hypothetical protein